MRYDLPWIKDWRTITGRTLNEAMAAHAEALAQSLVMPLAAGPTDAQRAIVDAEKRGLPAAYRFIRAELPDDLNTGNVINDVKTLRMAHESAHRNAYRWGKAALLLLPFVDMAAGEGIVWAEQEDGSPWMDAADLCVAFAEAMGCELGDDAYTAMMREGEAAIRALASAGEAGTAETGTGSVHEHAAPSGETPSQSSDPLSQTVAPPTEEKE